MKRLLAKLPRSSSGSRAASASSSASRWPFAIFDVSMTAAAGFSGFALVSPALRAAISYHPPFISRRNRGFSRYSPKSQKGLDFARHDANGVEERILVRMKFRAIPGVLPQNLAGQKFFFALCQPFQFLDDFVQSIMLRVAQWPTPEWRETRSQDHSVVCVLGRLDDFLFHAAGGFVDHQEDEPARQLFVVQPQTWIAVPVRRNVWAFGAFGLAMQCAPPLRERVIAHLRFALVFVKPGSGLPAKHLTVTQPQQDGRNVVAPPVSFLKCVADINSDIDADFVDQPQWAHRHAPSHKCAINLVRVQATLEELSRIEQIRKQNPV